MKNFSSENLPNHVPIHIDQSKIGQFKEELIFRGYSWTFLQVLKPRQLWGLVKTIDRKGIKVEHHVRAYVDGMITSEYELPRVEQMWMHLTTVSYSAHESIIQILLEQNLKYRVNEELREIYNKYAIDDYPRKYLEFVIWLWAVVFWTPLGYMWLFAHNLFNNNSKHNPKEKKISSKEKNPLKYGD